MCVLCSPPAAGEARFVCANRRNVHYSAKLEKQAICAAYTASSGHYAAEFIGRAEQIAECKSTTPLVGVPLRPQGGQAQPMLRWPPLSD